MDSSWAHWFNQQGELGEAQGENKALKGNIGKWKRHAKEMEESVATLHRGVHKQYVYS